MAMVIAEQNRADAREGRKMMNARKERGIWSLRARQRDRYRYREREPKGSAEGGREGGERKPPL